MSHGSRGTRPGKYVKDDIARIGADMNDPLKKTFRFRRGEWLFVRKECEDLFLAFLAVANFLMRPPGRWHPSLHHLR